MGANLPFFIHFIQPPVAKMSITTTNSWILTSLILVDCKYRRENNLDQT